MNVEFQGRGIAITDAVRGFTEKKLNKVLKFLDEPIESRFTFEPDRLGLTVDLHIAHRHGVIQAEETSVERYQEGVNAVIGKAEKQARRSRKRFMDVRRRNQRAVVEELHHWPVDVLDGPSLTDGTKTSRVIEVKKIPIKPMEVDEAALALDEADNPFIAFRHAKTGRVNVLYRLADGNYGLFAPDA